MRVVALAPVYNEKGKIGRVVEKTMRASVAEVVVVSDASNDGSDEEARARGATVLRHEKTLGVGAAIRTGFDYALSRGYEVVVVMAGNDKDDPSEISKLVAPVVERGFDYVQGSRYAPGGEYGRLPLHRLVLTQAYSWLVRVVTGFPITDATNGFRAIRATLLRDPRIQLHQDWLNRGELEYYLQLQAIRLGYKVCEVPVRKIYPDISRYDHYTKIRPVVDWIRNLRPLFYFAESLRACAVLTATAFFLNLIALFVLRRSLGPEYQGYYDDGTFIAMAQFLAGLGGGDIITHPPGYPIFLVPFLWAGRHGLLIATLFQIFLTAAVPALTYLLALALGSSRRAAFLAGVLCAANPMLIFFSTRIMSENLFVFLIVAFFLLWLRAWESRALRWAAAAGVVGALASLTRGVMLPFGGVVALAAFWQRKQNPRWLALVAVCGLAWAFVLAPWTARNAQRFGRFIPISVQGGWNFYEGLTLDREEIIIGRPAAMSAEVQALGLTDTFAIDDYFARKAQRWVKEHPGEFFGIVLRKAMRFWRPVPYPPHPLWVRWGGGVFYFVLFGLALAGIFLGKLSRPAWIFPLAWCGYLTVLHSLFVSTMRYRLPVEPMVAVAAGAGLAALLDWRKWAKIEVSP